MERATLPGVLRGEDLARAYASMDAFVFPSATDTFGNVVLEAMASGVPAIVTREGGPKYLVESGDNGELAGSAGEFSRAHRAMVPHARTTGRDARAGAQNRQQFSWDAVWEDVYRRYEASG